MQHHFAVQTFFYIKLKILVIVRSYMGYILRCAKCSNFKRNLSLMILNNAAFPDQFQFVP